MANGIALHGPSFIPDLNNLSQFLVCILAQSISKFEMKSHLKKSHFIRPDHINKLAF